MRDQAVAVYDVANGSKVLVENFARIGWRHVIGHKPTPYGLGKDPMQSRLIPRRLGLHRASLNRHLVIEAQAQCRLADEYDAAQARGEVQKAGGKRGNQYGIVPDENNASTVTDIGLTRKQVHEARQVRDAEKATPGVVRDTRPFSAYKKILRVTSWAAPRSANRR